MSTRLSPHVQRVLAGCEAHWDAHKSDCIGFVKAVASDLAISISGNGDGITEYLCGLPAQNNDGLTASLWAEQDTLVIAGLKGAVHLLPRTHGHVVIVVPGKLVHGKYALAYWGMLGSKSKKRTPLNWAWNHKIATELSLAPSPI